MSQFTLHQKLKDDCIELGVLPNSLLLLMNNSLVPWFILVPKTTVLELHELNELEQTELLANINCLSEFVVKFFNADKMNIASIGNIVNQMHIHVIGRKHDDFCWPGVVWGTTDRVDYEKEEISRIREGLKISLQQYSELADT